MPSGNGEPSTACTERIVERGVAEVDTTTAFGLQRLRHAGVAPFLQREAHTDALALLSKSHSYASFFGSKPTMPIVIDVCRTVQRADSGSAVTPFTV